VTALTRSPLRGEIWFVQLYTDPPGKGRRPVIIISLDARNRHEKADTVLAIPISTSVHKNVPFHLFLASGETGLSQDCIARAEDITVIRKSHLIEPNQMLRRLSESRLRELGQKVLSAMGFE